MFEKESKEYANKWLEHVKDLELQHKSDEKPEYIRILEAHQQGAEFGYNKANEWHYVKNGDLPKVNQKCYFIYSNVYGQNGKISFSKSDINVLTGVYAFFLDEETGEETTEPCFYDDINDDEIYLQEVYAWKEIELPKEIE